MAWLVSDDTVLASLDVLDTRAGKAKGLLGSDGTEGAVLLRKTRSVHTFFMRYSIDVGFCDAEMKLLKTITMKPHRLSLGTRGARHVIEAEAGAFEHWGLSVGDCLEVR